MRASMFRRPSGRPDRCAGWTFGQPLFSVASVAVSPPEVLSRRLDLMNYARKERANLSQKVNPSPH